MVKMIVVYKSLKQRLKKSGHDIRNSSIASSKHRNQKRTSDAVVERIIKSTNPLGGHLLSVLLVNRPITRTLGGL